MIVSSKRIRVNKEQINKRKYCVNHFFNHIYFILVIKMLNIVC